MQPRGPDEHGFPAKEADPDVHDIYNREAKVHDVAMVERWKTAMQGLLIFAGLFSATVTAFIIEGYKMLKPDSGDLTIAFLYQISQQMALTANGTNIPSSFLLAPPSEILFSPPWTAVTANILWLISLGLSLACAVAATLVQQWARNYIHTIERRPSAERRARMRMYLHEGVERFRMSQLVDGVPVLLHLSLFSFLLGLVFFIQTISPPATIITIAILFLSVGAYIYATLLPLVAFQSPIQTPLTNVVWSRPVIRTIYWVFPRILMMRDAMTYPSTWVWKQSRRCFQPVKLSVIILKRTIDSLLHPFTHVFRWAWLSELALAHWVQLEKGWSCHDFVSLDAVRSSAARETETEAFKEREKQAFTWLVECLDEDREILLFFEAMPTFVRKANRDHDAQSTFSYVFSHPRLRLYARLPALLHKHTHSERIQSVFADFHLRVREKDWMHIFERELAAPRDIWPDSSIMESSPPEIRVQMNSVHSTLYFCWFHAGHPWYEHSSPSNDWEARASRWWPDPFRLLWQQMLVHVRVFGVKGIPSYLRPTLFFTKATLDMLADMTPHNEWHGHLILQSHLPSSIAWFNESPTPGQQRFYLAILSTIVWSIGAKYQTGCPDPFGRALQPLLLRLKDISEEAVVRDLDRLLQDEIWDLSATLTLSFKPIVEAHMLKLDHSGHPLLSPPVITRYRLIMLMQASTVGDAVAAVRPLSLLQTSPSLQRSFVASFEMAYLSAAPSTVDAETGVGVDQVALLVESAIQVLYTLNDLKALKDALHLLNRFFGPEECLYHEYALRCRGYLGARIRRKELLDSVRDCHSSSLVVKM